MIIRINCNVFMCFYVYEKVVPDHGKNAYVCTAHQNSQNVINYLEYEKTIGICGIACGKPDGKTTRTPMLNEQIYMLAFADFGWPQVQNNSVCSEVLNM